ncbi:MAG: sulfatase-like hydrolase/transferase, partial [Acidimicrobiaceae bacterium]|nr:sulfatase-like hydrolase/transferase [Acidimicrobiaceae bacterium]
MATTSTGSGSDPSLSHCCTSVEEAAHDPTPLCSPTRAALVTGRSQHAVGMRSLANFRTGFPHQLGHVSNHAATIAEVLSAIGYATFCAGKWHLGHTQDGSAAGPFDRWPLGRGFDRFYGFLDHTDDQIGRLVGGLERLGQLDNTILMVVSDNGASQEGGPLGVMHEMKWFNGIREVPEQAIARLDEIGGPRSTLQEGGDLPGAPNRGGRRQHSPRRD